jgi:hypothetical protein
VHVRERIHDSGFVRSARLFRLFHRWLLIFSTLCRLCICIPCYRYSSGLLERSAFPFEPLLLLLVPVVGSNI